MEFCPVPIVHDLLHKKISPGISEIGHSSEKQAPTMGFLQTSSKAPLISAPPAEHCSVAISATLLTTNVNNRCGKKARNEELFVFYVDLVI